MNRWERRERMLNARAGMKERKRGGSSPDEILRGFEELKAAAPYIKR